jgi:hypothetical protein
VAGVKYELTPRLTAALEGTEPGQHPVRISSTILDTQSNDLIIGLDMPAILVAEIPSQGNLPLTRPNRVRRGGRPTDGAPLGGDRAREITGVTGPTFGDEWSER